MNFRQLELFVAVAEQGSMSRGAETVSLAQSTASQHISALEEEAGVALLDRAARGVSMSPAGVLFLEHARRVLRERDSLVQSLSAFRGLEKATLTIGASNIPANYLIPPLLPVLHQKHPGISLSVSTGDTQGVLDQLLRAEVELAIVGSCPHDKLINFTALTKDSLVLVVGAGHRWADRTMVSLDELLHEPLIVRERGSGSGQTLELALKKCGINAEKLKVSAMLGSNEAVLQAVACDFGCAFVSELSVKKLLERQELRAVQAEGLKLDRKIWIAQLKTRSPSPAALAFVKLISEYYSG